MRYANALGGFSFHRSSELKAHNLSCVGVSLLVRLFFCISHRLESNSVSNCDFYIKEFNNLVFHFFMEREGQSYSMFNICTL